MTKYTHIVGDEVLAKDGSFGKVVEVKGKKVLISFFPIEPENKVFEKWVDKSNVGRGSFNNPLHPTHFGVGCLGENIGTPKSRKAYLSWRRILARCYGNNPLIHRGSYLNTTVSKEWLNFINFQRWYLDNHEEGYDIDKDILCTNKELIYSEDTCVFIPCGLNQIMKRSVIDAKHYSPQGKSYRVGLGREHFGLFSCEIEASKVGRRVNLQAHMDKVHDYYQRKEVDFNIYIRCLLILSGVVELKGIIACGEDGSIGVNGKLPWDCPEDLRYFRSVTEGSDLLVGRITCKTLPKLPNRVLHQVSTTTGFLDIFKSIVEDDPRNNHMYCIGGSCLMKSMLPVLSELSVTTIQGDYPEADTHMNLDFLLTSDWYMVSEEQLCDKACVRVWRRV